jgi:pimeloyl-ACP methyl ester carboxylesterase
MTGVLDFVAASHPTTVATSRGIAEYATCGAGPAVLLLHGAMGGWDQGMMLAAAAIGPAPFQAIAVSRPGYLGTPLALGTAPAQQADVCADVLAALGVQRAAVVAISGGGQCALQFALRHPGRCRALVMISACSAPIAVRIPLRFHLLRVMARFPSLVARMRKKTVANLDTAAARSIPDPILRARTLNHPEVGPLFIEHLLSIMEHMPQRMPGTRNDIAQSRASFAYPVEYVATPTLIVHGTDDEAAPFAQAESLAARLPNSEFLAIPGGRHVSLFTHHALIQPRIREFLERT